MMLQQACAKFCCTEKIANMMQKRSPNKPVPCWNRPHYTSHLVGVCRNSTGYNQTDTSQNLQRYSDDRTQTEAFPKNEIGDRDGKTRPFLDHEPHAATLLVHGLSSSNKLEQVNRLLSGIEKGSIINVRPLTDDSAVVTVKDLSFALNVIERLDGQHLEGTSDVLVVTLTAQEVLRLRNIGYFDNRLRSAATMVSTHERYKTSQTEIESLPGSPSSFHTYSKNDRKELAVKVFVGCLPKTATEAALSEVFSKFGRVLDVRILRDNNANTKYSAFVYFESMESAIDSIRQLNRQFTMPNGKRAIEVRLAELKGLRVPRSKDVLANRKLAETQQASEKTGINMGYYKLPYYTACNAWQHNEEAFISGNNPLFEINRNKWLSTFQERYEQIEYTD
ncbi:hypothetical protein IE077_000841 [Cardiosporidium cionae]|uniref:RRM domain-containing protein n=1 Tax=Cardiosporidium cionae TaxID=476202 RepID=A0ABQ7JDT9_9APIC|nr:hypothetical protein IE077_000841 [Cardiosporidium cionae]|eukprot:KAF8822188.1 hypothetical protein IE077_000841 [Cardiosporidium cionae]